MYVHVTLRSLLHLPNEECALSRSDQVGSTISGLWSNAPELQTGNSRGLSHYHRLLYMVSPNLMWAFALCADQSLSCRLRAMHLCETLCVNLEVGDFVGVGHAMLEQDWQRVRRT